jgi:hypothetical protein
MSWELLISIVPFIIFMVGLAYYERLEAKKEIEKNKIIEKSITPAATLTNRLYEKRYGKPSRELIEEFPDLKIVR